MRKASVSFLTVVLVTGCAQLLGKTDAPEPTPESPAATRLTVVAAGDLLIHPDVTDQATADARAAGRDGQDFTKIIADVRPVVSEADLAICHLETPLAEPSGPFSGYPLFNVPPAVADAAAWAGFDTCSTASNHSLDMGVAGIRRTLDKLDQVGLRHAGTARSAEEAAQPTLLDVNGVRVAHLSYTLSFNGIPRPAGQEWVANLLDQDAILAEARRARERGAEIVILSAHWGTEYQHEPDETQQQLARALLASPDIDLIVGHHAHVVQPFEKIGDKWVAYGLGNLTTHNRSEPVRHSVIPGSPSRGVTPGGGSSPTLRSSPPGWRTSRRIGSSTSRERSPAATSPPSGEPSSPARTTRSRRSSIVAGRPRPGYAWRGAPPQRTAGDPLRVPRSRHRTRLRGASSWRRWPTARRQCRWPGSRTRWSVPDPAGRCSSCS
ncbi:MAG TPA: CapA family protein [Micromonospora sp.]